MQTGNFDEKKFNDVKRPPPVVGYCGFLKGVKAQNQYAQTYEQLARGSQRQQ